MALFITGIIVLLLSLLISVILFNNRKKGAGTGVITAGLIFSAFIIFISCFTTIPTGYTGIVTTFGRVENKTLEAGLNLKAPWQDVVKMDNRNQKAVIDMLCFTSDIQEVSIRYSINYQINKETAPVIYRSIGTDYYTTVMLPRIQEAVKSVIARYNAETLIESRAEFSNQIYQVLEKDLSIYNIEIITASVEDIDFNEAFTNAVEAKQVAAQKKLQAQIEEEQKTMEQKAAAERAVLQANADAEVSVIQAQADLEIVKIQADAAEYAGQKDAAVNTAIANSLTPELLYYYYIKAWNGELPATYISQEDFMAMFAIETPVKADQ